jgi:hypothetical protein
LGEVTGVGVGHDAPGVVAEGELGVAEEGVVGGGDEGTGHSQDGVGGAGPDAGGQFLGLRFQFGGQRCGHGGLLPAEIPPVTQSHTEVNAIPTNFRDAYPRGHYDRFSAGLGLSVRRN